MRIRCPHCGERDLREFAYLGDAGMARPAVGASSAAAFDDYVYQRENPAGRHREYWFHAFGCHGWLVVTRDTVTHAIERVEPASGTS